MRTMLGRVLREAAWAPAIVLVAHTVGGHFFGHEPVVDPVSHFSGGVAAAFFFRRAAEIAVDLLGELKPAGLDVLAFALTATIAVFWEIGEFASDRITGGNVQRGLGNTMRDLICGISGGGCFLVVWHLVMKWRGRGEMKRRVAQ